MANNEGKINNEGNIGELITFPELLGRVGDVVIPKVQRDYAYGRPEEKIEEILNGMLKSMIEAVVNDKPVILDFIYGGASVKNSQKSAGLIPLDGQQRLTTLWLLYFYVSVLDNIPEDSVGILKKFRYETRESANAFCGDLVNGIRKHILEQSYFSKKDRSITDMIKDDALYRASYDTDPTIVSMINVLKVIEDKCRRIPALELNLWERLNTRRNIKFYEMPLDEFGLTDDLYIKMNSRGKRLTRFEIFKADIISQIKSLGEEASKLADDFANLIDGTWIDIPWSYTDKTVNDERKVSDVTADVDSKYENLVRNILSLYAYREGLPTPENPELTDVFKDVDSVKNVMEYFGTLYNIYNIANGDFNNVWGRYFYQDSDVVGKENKIRVRVDNVFELAMNDALRVQPMIYFYCFYLLYKDEREDSERFDDLRIVRNLITNNARLSSARVNNLHDFLIEAEYVIRNHGIKQQVGRDNPLTLLKSDGSEEPHQVVFNHNTWNEEYLKLQFSRNIYEKLLRYENHDILDTSLSLFIEKCEIDEKQIDENALEHLMELLQKFETVFDNGCRVEDRFTNIRVSFLDKETDYLQYESYMMKDNKRYFLTGYKRLSQFFIKYVNRQNQSSILELLEDMPSDAIDKATEKYKSFDNESDWQYYVAKYPEDSNFDFTSYGMGTWDDKEHWPLDLILLNSSYHSNDNLEWKMINRIVWSKLGGDNTSYRLDNHGSRPIEINRVSTTINFTHNSWEITSELNVPDIISSIQGLHCEYKEEKGCYYVTFSEKEHSMDYVELGIKLAELIANC